MADDESTHIGRDVNVNDGDFVTRDKMTINLTGTVAEAAASAYLAEIEARKRIEVDNCRRMIDQLDQNRFFDLVKYFERIEEIQTKIDGDRNRPDNPWAWSEVRGYFEQYISRNDLGFFALFVRLMSVENLSDLSPENVVETLEKIGSRNEISVAIEWAIGDSELPREYRHRAVAFLLSTYKIIDYGFSLEYFEQLHWSSLLNAWSTISFWRRGPAFVRSWTLEIGQNAFISPVAESDPFLFPPGQTRGNWTFYTSQPPKLRPEWYHELHFRMRDSHPVFVVGDHGFGKTAAALMLAWDEVLARSDGQFLPSSTLPVYSPYYVAPSADSFLKQYALAYAKTLMGYLAATPYEFLQAPERQQSAMAMVLVCCLGSIDELRAQFSQHRFRRTPMPPRFFDVLKENMTGINPTRVNLKDIETERLFPLLLNAMPNSVVRRLPLVDIQASDALIGKPSSFLDTLIPTLNRLAENGIGATVFVPRNLANQISLPDDVMFPAWTYAEITQLLENRLSAVTRTERYDLSVFCDFRAVDNIEDVQRRLIESSHMLPGRLIEIVQRFISRIERTNALLNQREIDEIFDSFS